MWVILFTNFCTFNCPKVGSQNLSTTDPIFAGVSFDDKTTFQQKIDFANQNGLNGLFIWAIDLDDSTYTALKAVTGRDLTPSVGESSTLGYFNVDKCFITACGSDCPDGFTTLVSS